jgi:hypothetical protein
VKPKDNENDTLYIEDFASIHNTKKYESPYYDEITSGYESLIKNHIPLIIDIFKQPKNGNKVTFPRTIRPNQYINRLHL